MSLWEFAAATGGYAKAHGGGEERLPAEVTDRLAAKFLSMRPDLQA